MAIGAERDENGAWICRSGKLLEIKVFDYGGSPVATHNMPCAVCRTRHAVIMLSEGIFQPCWECQAKGWKLKKSWWR